MAHIKQFALAALIALALAAGAAAGSGAAKGSFDLAGGQAVEQVAGSKAAETFGRESS